MHSGKRGRPKNEEMQRVYELLHDKYPKFGRVQMCMIRNPEYGLQMAQGAVSILEANGIYLNGKNKNKKVKQASQRKKENKITVRLSDAEKVRLLELKEQAGCKSVQEYIEKIIKGE